MPSYEYTLVLGGWRRTKIHSKQAAPNKPSPKSPRKPALQQQEDNLKFTSHTTNEISMIPHINGSPLSMERYSLPRLFPELPRLTDRYCNSPFEHRESETRSKNFGLESPYLQKHRERARKHGPKHPCCISVYTSDQNPRSLDDKRQTPPNEIETHAPETPCGNCGYLGNHDLQQMRPHNALLTSGVSRLKLGHRVLSFANAWHEFSIHTITALDFFKRFDAEFREETQFMTVYANMRTMNQMWKTKILQNEKYGGRPKVGFQQDGHHYDFGRPQKIHQAADNSSKNAHPINRVSTFEETQYNLEKSTFDLLNSQLLPPRLRGHYELDIGDDDDYSDPRDALDLLQYRNANTVLERISQWSYNLFPLFTEVSKHQSSMQLLLAELKYMVDTISNSQRMLPGVFDLSSSNDPSHAVEAFNAAADENHNRTPPRGRSRSRSRSRNRAKGRDVKDKGSAKEKTHEDNVVDPKSKDETKGKGKTRNGD